MVFFLGLNCEATTFYDNGAPDLRNGLDFTFSKVANRFTLTADVIGESVTFWDLEANTASWMNFIFWEIRLNSSGDVPGTVLFTGGSTNLSHVATGRNKVINNVPIPEFVNMFDLPSVSLPAGSYWLVLHNGPLSNNAFANANVFWETTTSSRTDPSYSDEATGGTFTNTWRSNGSGSQLAFQVGGTVKPQVTAFGFVSVTPRVSFTTVTGQNYKVEYKNNMTDASWTTVSGASNVSGTGGVIQISDPDPNLPNLRHRFYRVAVL